MNIVIIDGQGGRLGKTLVEAAIVRFPDARITAVGTNTIATAAMIKAGAKRAATGENAVVVACRDADFIIGPIGIVIADSLFGEITPKMACAVARSASRRILIPVNRCDHIIAGVGEQSLSALIADAVDKIAALPCPLD